MVCLLNLVIFDFQVGLPKADDGEMAELGMQQMFRS